MIVLDTNVLSELTRVSPAQQVVDWLDAQPSETLFITSVTLAEQGFGIACLPAGRRRDALLSALTRTAELYEGRILPFDAAAALAYAGIASAARAQGRGLPVPDGYIAAIAAAKGYAVATRDEGPFRAAGLRVINPWEAQP